MEPTILQSIALVAIGGAIGAVLRFGTGQLVDSSQFPWATFTVNIVGSFFLALLTFGWTGIPQEIRLLLFTGLFGAFTTMSTFTVESVTLLADEKFAAALGNFLLNPCLCVAGAFVGRYIALLL